MNRPDGTGLVSMLALGFTDETIIDLTFVCVFIQAACNIV